MSTTEPTRRQRRRIAAAVTLAATVATAACVAAGASAVSDDDTSSSSGPDPMRDEQWGLDELLVPQAWDHSTGCGTTIAVVDSGVDLDHPDLRDRLVAGHDFVDGDEEPDDENGHGTHVAGIAAASADNATGVAGVAPCAQIMPIRVLDAGGSGDDATIAEGIRWAVDHGADVVNLSLGESGILGRLRAGGELNGAIVDAHDAGAVVIAASGNDGTPRVRNYRIEVPVIVVGATAPDGDAAEFSNFGDLRTLVAPGVAILSTAPSDATAIWPDRTDGYEPLDGTSMAAPHVAGVAALLLAQGRTADEVEEVLFATTVDPRGDVRLGAGLVDALAAVAYPVG